MYNLEICGLIFDHHTLKGIFFSGLTQAETVCYLENVFKTNSGLYLDCIKKRGRIWVPFSWTQRMLEV